MTQSSSSPPKKPFPVGEIYGNEQRIAAIFNWFLGLMLVSLLAGIFILLSNKNNLEATITGVSTLPVLLGIYLVHRKKFEGAATLLAIFMIILMTLLATRGQGAHNITILGFPAVLIVASLVVRKRFMVLLTLFCIICVAWLVFGDFYGLYMPNQFTHSVPGDFFSISLVLIATAVMVRLLTESLIQSNLQSQRELRERKLAEQALAFSEKRFFEAFHSSPVMMTIEGEDHRFLDVNQAFCDAIGYGREEALGRTATDLNLWAVSEDIERVRKLVEAQKSIKNLEVRFRRRSGEIGWILMSNDRFEANGTAYELTSGLDITERKRADEALRESESRFRGFVENTTDGIFLANDQGKVIEWNSAMERIAGLKREDALGQTVWDIQVRLTPSYLIGDEPTDDLKSRYLRIFEDGDLPLPYQLGIETRIQHLNGTQRVVEQKVFLLQTTQGYALGILIHDITERRQMEDTLFEEKELAEVTLRSIGDAVITTNIQAQVEFLNPIAENLTGWKMEEAVGRELVDVFRVINENTREPVIDPVARCLREGRVVGLANHSVLIRRDGCEFSIDDSAAPIRNRKGEIIGTVLVFHDITEERRLSLQVAHDAIHDSLTGLVNRREFERRLERALMSTKERDLSHVLCYLDMDQFKIVNDTAGHAAGDELLKQIAVLLGGLFRQSDTFARLGGDEFGLLLENCQIEQAQVICNKILARTRDFSFVWDGNSFQAGVSIGIVPITSRKESVTELLSQADIACYSAKDLGRNRHYLYQSEDIETAQRHSEIIQAARMRDAVLNDQFVLYCQPIIDLASSHSEFMRYEVLLRMQNEENSLVLPSAFIPSAERYGLMPAIDRWVIRQTFSAMAKNVLRNVQVTINLSGNSLDDENLLPYVLEQMQEFSIPPDQICFEITETAAIQHINKARQFIQGFRERGGKIALDDFGSGFSSFRYLRTLTVDYLKIDGAFVSEMLFNPNDQAMVEAITQVAHTLGIYVIAEHATNIETVNRLRELGVEGAQGFGIGFPIPVDEAWQNRG